MARVQYKSLLKFHQIKIKLTKNVSNTLAIMKDSPDFVLYSCKIFLFLGADKTSKKHGTRTFWGKWFETKLVSTTLMQFFKLNSLMKPKYFCHALTVS